MSTTIDDLVARVYSNFRGADFRGEEVNLSRSPDCLNVWKDYKELDSIHTRPETELHTAFEDPVHGIFFFHNGMLVHSGSALYRVEGAEKRKLYEGLAEAKSEAFFYDDKWYFKDGALYLCYDGTSTKEVEGYVPTTSIGRKPSGGGTTYEDVNLLSSHRKNTFLADGESKDYYLDAREIDKDFTPVVTVDGGSVTAFTVDYDAGKISFTTAPAAPLTDGQDNVAIEFRKTAEGHADRIKKCTLLQVFDSRVFFSGNPDFPNVVWHCSLNDPTYCSDLDYYEEGMDDAAVRGMVAGNNALWVFREPSSANTTVFYHTPTLDEEYGKIYPSCHSSVTTGCIGRAINFNDDIVFFSDRGMEGISGDVTTEQVVAHRSSLVDRKLAAEEGYTDMILTEWEGYLLVIVGNHVYLADSRTAFTNENHIEYEWFYWELSQKVLCAAVEGGVLYFGTEEGVYTLTGNGSVESYWVTPKDKFKYPHRQKTTNKRGCVTEATGDIDLYVRVEDEDFELVGRYTDIVDYFAARVKRKKFKDLQLKFYSGTRFSLEMATMECYIGGYIKR